jgi:acyl-CoA hydrolase
MSNEDTVVAKGTFVFASIGGDHKSLPVTKLKLETEEEMEKAYRGQQRYEMAKRARAKSAALEK